MLLDDTPTVGGGLYIIWLSDTHYYGGRTNDYVVRWSYHLYDLRRGKHRNRYMQAVFNKHGRFEPEVVKSIGPESEQVAAEQQWLDLHHGQPGCVNLSKSAYGGMLGREHTAESKQRMRDAVTAEAIAALIHRNQSRVWSEEDRQRHAEVHRGFKHSADTCAKISMAHKSNPAHVAQARDQIIRVNKSRIGQIRTEAHRRALSEALKGRVASPEVVEKRAAAQRGRKNTEETRLLMSESAKRRATEQPTVHDADTRELISQQQKGRVWVNDGVTNRRLFPAEAQELLDQGWLPGRKARPEGASHGNSGRTHSPQARENMGASKRGRARSPEAVAKTAAANRGRKNSPEALANLKAAGMLRRGCPRDPAVVERMRDMVWINDGTRNLRLASDAAQPYLDEGWSRGQLR